MLHNLSPGRSPSERDILGALANALRARGRPNTDARIDADGGYVGRHDTIEAYARDVDARAAALLGTGWRPSADAVALVRGDALPSGAPGFPRDFDFIRRQVIEEKRQALSAMTAFAIDSSVPLGAKTHTARRSLGSGEAQIYRGGSEFPRASVTYAEEQFGTAIVVCAVEQNYFDALSQDFAALRTYQDESRLAVRLVEERLNRIACFGDSGSKLWGAFNYPSLAKVVISTPFTDASAPEDCATALGDFVCTPMVRSSGTFGATHLAISPKMAKFLATRPTTLAANLFILEMFLKGQQLLGGGGITADRITVMPELAGIGPSGEDGILAYRKDPDTMAHVVIQQPTALPVFQSSPVDQTTVIVAVTGGMTAADIGNCILGYVTVQS